MDWKRSRQAGRAAAEDARVAVLMTSPAFAGCDPEALHRVAALGTEVRRDAGTVLQRCGATLRQALVVLEGDLAERPASGRERVVSAGHVVGEDALARVGVSARSTATAVTDVRVLVFGPGDLPEIADLLRVRPAPKPAPAPAGRPVARPAPEPSWGSARPAVA